MRNEAALESFVRGHNPAINCVECLILYSTFGRKELFPINTAIAGLRFLVLPHLSILTVPQLQSCTDLESVKLERRSGDTQPYICQKGCAQICYQLRAQDCAIGWSIISGWAEWHSDNHKEHVETENALMFLHHSEMAAIIARAELEAGARHHATWNGR
jgi:hypothetical protein